MSDSNISSSSRMTAFLLSLFLRFLGVHRFYVGKIGTGILWLITGGFLGIGAFIDMIVILCGGFRDADHKKVINWK